MVPLLHPPFLYSQLIQHGFTGAEEFLKPGFDMPGVSFGQDDRNIRFPGNIERQIAEECPSNKPSFRSPHDDQVVMLDFSKDSLCKIVRF